MQKTFRLNRRNELAIGPKGGETIVRVEQSATVCIESAADLRLHCRPRVIRHTPVIRRTPDEDLPVK